MNPFPDFFLACHGISECLWKMELKDMFIWHKILLKSMLSFFFFFHNMYSYRLFKRPLHIWAYVSCFFDTTCVSSTASCAFQVFGKLGDWTCVCSLAACCCVSPVSSAPACSVKGDVLSLPRLILSQLKWLDRVVDSKVGSDSTDLRCLFTLLNWIFGICKVFASY